MSAGEEEHGYEAIIKALTKASSWAWRAGTNFKVYLACGDTT